MKTAPSYSQSIDFDIWGSRGSRSLVPPQSVIGNNTPCYSLHRGEDMFVLDGGRGLGALDSALRSQDRFQGVKRIHLLISHAHMDHWEGLKDASWFWYPDSNLEINIFGSAQALRTIHRAYTHPSYVPLSVLVESTRGRIRFIPLQVGDRRALRGWRLKFFPLNHNSGSENVKRQVDTIGLRISTKHGPIICYMSDHEPTERTQTLEKRMLGGAHLALLDAYFLDIQDHAYGHGSIEHASHVAKTHPKTLILAGHHGPVQSDDEIREAYHRHGRGVSNLRLAEEGTTFRWDPRKKSFLEI